jgi:Protein of unknown function (DUF2726)
MSPYLLVPLLVLGAVLVVLLWFWVRGRGASVPPGRQPDFDRLDTLAAWPPQATRILTTHERLAYSTLIRAFPDYMVLAQVPLSRFLKVPTRHSHAEWLRRVGNLCADLLVCDMASQVIAVIIVQAPGGLASERAAVRRERMARVLKAVGIRMLVWVENALPSPDAARDAILPAPAPAVGASAPVPAPVVAVAAAGAGPAGASLPDDAGVEPPPTWYDDLDSRPTPLKPLPKPEAAKR